MDAVTYPDAEVQRVINENFVPVKLDISEARDKETMDRMGVMWTPTIMTLDENGKEVRRSTGYLPPYEFVPELYMAVGQHWLAQGEFAKAHDRFVLIARDYPQSAVAAEAMYWAGMAHYKRDNDPAGLAKHWHELRDRHPDSPWWTKAQFIDRAA